MGLRDLASKAWTVNRGWVLAANIAAGLTAWIRLLGLHDQPDLAHADAPPPPAYQPGRTVHDQKRRRNVRKYSKTGSVY